MSGQAGRSGILGWTGPLAVLLACVAGAAGGWLCAAAVAGLLREPLGSVAATVVGAVTFFPAAFVGFASSLVVMSLLLAIAVRKLPNGTGSPGDDRQEGGSSEGSDCGA